MPFSVSPPHVFHKQCNLPPESQSTPWHWLRHSAEMYELHLGLWWWRMRCDFPYMPPNELVQLLEVVSTQTQAMMCHQRCSQGWHQTKNNCARTVNIDCSFLIVSPPTLCLCSLYSTGLPPTLLQPIATKLSPGREPINALCLEAHFYLNCNTRM